jgi:gentisate 1,2-dioxygenase
MDELTRDAGAVEYSRAANPIASGATPPMPVHEFAPIALENAVTGVTPLDLSESLRCPGPASSPGLLANFVVVRAGETLRTNASATSQLWFARCGSGVVEVDGFRIPYGPRDLVTLPHSGEAVHTAETDTIWYWVHDEPLLRYLGVAPDRARFRPTVWRWDMVKAEVDAAAADPLAKERSRISVLLTNTNFPQTMTITHVLWAMVGVLPAGADQLPHRHQSVALDYIIECPPGCCTKVAEHVDADGNLVDPIVVPWQTGGAFTTPPGWWHSHHNASGRDAYLMPIQDAGLHTMLRTLDIRFHRANTV